MKYMLCPREHTELHDCGSRLLTFSPSSIGISKRSTEDSNALDFIRKRTFKKGSLCTYIIEMKDNVATDSMILYLQKLTNVKVAIHQYLDKTHTKLNTTETWSKSSNYSANFKQRKFTRNSYGSVSFKLGTSTFAFMTVTSYDTRYDGNFEFKI